MGMEDEKKPYQPTDEEMKKAEGMVPDEYKERDKYREEAFSAGEKKGEIETNDKENSPIKEVAEDIKFLKSREDHRLAKELAEEKEITGEKMLKSIFDTLESHRYQWRYGVTDHTCEVVGYRVDDKEVFFRVDPRPKFTNRSFLTFAINKDKLLSLWKSGIRNPQEIWNKLYLSW